MYLIRVTFPDGSEGIVCQHINYLDELRVYPRDADTGSYFEVYFETKEDAEDAVAEIRFGWDVDYVDDCTFDIDEM